MVCHKEYDHKAARAKMSSEEKLQVLTTAEAQYKQAYDSKPIDCAGTNCKRRRVLLHMFRCWFCGQYFCPVCAREHFGERANFKE